MKKIAIFLMAGCMLLSLLPLRSNAAAPENPSSVLAPPPAESKGAAEAKTLELRLTEIDAMDKSKMKSAEKKSLRKEVKSINKELRTIGGGVYLSVGAILLIILLLVILL